MSYATKYMRAAPVDSLPPASNSPSAGEATGHWLPSHGKWLCTWNRSGITDPDQDNRVEAYDEEESWADLAAAARAEWCAENPF